MTTIMPSEIHQQTSTIERAGSITVHHRFDWMMTGLSAWLIGGMYLDGWAHFHDKVDQSFFTPWHAILYSGLLAVLLFLGFALYKKHRKGAAWRQALPEGYNLSLIGALIFSAGGGFDLVWHTLFGIEETVDATVSPSHLILALGMILIVSGPARSIWIHTRSDASSLKTLLPMLLSVMYVLSVLAFFTPYIHPLVDTWAAASIAADHEINLGSALGIFLGEALGAGGILLQSALLMGIILTVLRRWALPFGSMAVILTLNAALVSVLHDQYRFIPVVALAGLISDGLYYWLKPSTTRLLQLRVFSFLTPLVYFLLYFTVLALMEPIWWSVHMVVGTVVLAGVVGLLLSYVFVAPAIQFKEWPID